MFRSAVRLSSATRTLSMTCCEVGTRSRLTIPGVEGWPTICKGCPNPGVTRETGC